MQTMPLDQAEGRLVEIVERLAPGEEIVLTRDDKPVATIRATSAASREPPRFGTLKGSILSLAPDFDAIPQRIRELPALRPLLDIALSGELSSRIISFYGRTRR